MTICHRCLLVVLLAGSLGPGCASDRAASTHDDPTRSSETREWIDSPPFISSDIVIAIDHSTLALLASGLDVDQDGVVGRNRDWVIRENETLPTPAKSWTTDSDDTVEALQLEVARALVARLADRGNRIGLASFTLRAWSHGPSLIRFTDKPRTVVPVGSPNAVLAALTDFPAVREYTRTDLARLLALAAELLDGASPQKPTRPRTILLLSPGKPAAPDGIYWSSRRAAKFGDELGEREIAVWAVPFGSESAAYLDELTRNSGGDVVSLDQLDAVFAVPAPGAAVSQQDTE
jgi:hypothetical protein